MPNKIIPLLLILLLFCCGQAQEFQTRIFVLKARPAESTVELVRPLLSPGGKVVPETRLNKLIVRDTPDVLTQVEALLQEVDQHAPQVRIHITMNGVSQSQAGLAEVGVSGSVRNPTVSGTAVSSTTSSQVRSQQNILVLSGERGVIHMARQVANPNPFVQLALQAGLIGPDMAFQNVGTGFAVEPVVVGDVVRIRVTPWMSFVGASGATEVQVSEAASSFAVKSGDSIPISSSGYSNSLKNRSFGLIFGSGGQQTQTQANIVLRPVISDY